MSQRCRDKYAVTMKGLLDLGGEVCSGLISHRATHCSRPFGRHNPSRLTPQELPC
jgi:hypothetical protein